MIKKTLKFIAFCISFCLLVIYGIVPMRLRLIFLKIFSLVATKIKPVFNLRLPPNEKILPLKDQIVMNTEEDACVHYSGGSDSTLVATYLAENFRRVHLLTFCHCTISSVDNRTYNIRNLKRIYGNDRFVFQLIDIDNLFRRMYIGRQFRDFCRYFLFTLVPCGTCRFAMHLRTIVYCIENGIRYVSDGSNQFYQMANPSEMPSILALIRELYASHGIQYMINPVYNKDDADNELYEKGIVSRKDLRSDWNTYKKIQPICNCGLFFLIIARTYWFYLHGVEHLSSTAFRYYQEKMPLYRRLIDKELSQRKTKACLKPSQLPPVKRVA